jgi:catechol 2,3-dioxygenase-like lactoylglutathione lyase family enzyme
MHIHHLALRTDDVDALERFYTEVLGLSVRRRDAGRSSWLDASPTIVMIERRDVSEPGIDSTTKELVCFAIAASEQDAFAERLAAASVVVEARTAYTLYFRDPDGRRIGVSSYPNELSSSNA